MFFLTFLFLSNFIFVFGQTEAPSKVIIDVDDDVEVAILLGGWKNEQPILIRSDGKTCQDSDKNNMPKFPQGPFVDAGAVYLPNQGIILCGGLVGTRENHVSTNKCYFMDQTRTIMEDFNLRFVEMAGSELPIDYQSSPSDGSVSMVAKDSDKGLTATRLFLHCNKTGHIYEGMLQTNNDCDYSSDIQILCSRLTISWTQLSQELPSFLDFHLVNHPCLTLFKGQVTLMGGLNQLGWPIRTSFALNPTDRTFSLESQLTIPAGSRVFHACFSSTANTKEHTEEQLYLAGGLQHPLEKTYVANDFYKITSNGKTWTKLPSMNVHRSSFGLVALKTGHKFQTNILPIGGILVDTSSEPFTYEITDSVEIFSGEQWTQVSGGGLPEMGRFVTLVVPYNFTFSCQCVPEPKVDKCYFIEEDSTNGEKI